ncbi:PLAT/LH2 domain-containing protein [Dioscorea alata]|uniref:PLAT/LH2 domain-containing protein n=1 Tax=Dioscorea alata TaxID=55571 RepID=A0ACB7W8Q9_DIOAL|nr:PLAT/LH2 domain-containing protein [Dioscorea alata]
MFPRAIPLLLLILSIIPSFIESEDNTKMINKIKSSGDDEYECVYTVYVQTGTKVGAGTDSVISLTLTQEDGHGVLIKNLEAWGGIMGSNHDYFEAGNLDIFSGRGPCLSSPTPCRMNLTSDGTGNFPDWYCNYVEVTTTRPRGLCAQRLFSVGQWLDTGKPFVVRDYCSEPDDGNHWPAAPRRIAA